MQLGQTTLCWHFSLAKVTKASLKGSSGAQLSTKSAVTCDRLLVALPEVDQVLQARVELVHYNLGHKKAIKSRSSPFTCRHIFMLPAQVLLATRAIFMAVGGDGRRHGKKSLLYQHSKRRAERVTDLYMSGHSRAPLRLPLKSKVPGKFTLCFPI